MINNIRKPEDLFVRCSWHTPKGAIVLRKSGQMPYGVLLDRLDTLLPQSHGMCKPCEARVEREELSLSSGLLGKASKCTNGV